MPRRSLSASVTSRLASDGNVCTSASGTRRSALQRLRKLTEDFAGTEAATQAEKLLADEFNRVQDGERFDLVDHRTYVFLGDGCLMEGISHEACSLAGTLKLSKLIAFYDDNGISIDGDVQGWFTDDTPKRFEAYGWNVIRAVDGHDAAQVEQALEAALAHAERADAGPTLICCRTVIGHGAPNKAGSHDVHGAPLGAAEVQALRAHLAWDHEPFHVPADVAQAWDARPRGASLEAGWRERFNAYRVRFPAQAAEFGRRMAGELPAAFGEALARLEEGAATRIEPTATRKSSQLALDALAPALPERVPAAHKGDMGGCSFYGFKEDGTRFLLMNIFGGGWGGRPFEDGESAACTVCQGDVRNSSIEEMEMKAPVLMKTLTMRRDSGGPGRFRGGFGQKYVLRMLEGEHGPLAAAFLVDLRAYGIRCRAAQRDRRARAGRVHGVAPGGLGRVFAAPPVRDARATGILDEDHFDRRHVRGGRWSP